MYYGNAATADYCMYDGNAATADYCMYDGNAVTADYFQAPKLVDFTKKK